MTAFGVVEQTSGTTFQTVSSGSTGYFVGGNFPGGTVTALKLRVGDRNSGGSFNDWDVALYSGGSASGPSGASKVWNSKRYTSSTVIGSTGPATFYSVVDGSDAAPNVVVAAGYLWVVVRSNDGVNWATLDSNGVNSGDFQTYGQTGIRAMSAGSGGTWDDPFTGNHTSAREVGQAFVEYTAGGGAIAAIAGNHARRRRS